MYDSRIARWLTTDPTGQYANPYVAMGNDPVNGVDVGMDSPIYDNTTGALLGTDDRGLKGDAIFMTKETFEKLGGRGMIHDIAVNNNLGINSLSDMNARMNFLNNPLTGFDNLSKRPDWDGVMSYTELLQWGKDNGNAGVFLEASKIDLGNISANDFPSLGKAKYINTVGKGTPLDTYGTWGTNHMTLMSSHGKVKLGEDSFDYRQHGWKNIFDSKGVHFWYELVVRRVSIATLQMYHGVDNSYGFPLKPYGYGQVKSNNFTPMPKMSWNLDW